MLLGLGVALCAVEPFVAAGGADGDLGVEDVFAFVGFLLVFGCGDFGGGGDVPHGGGGGGGGDGGGEVGWWWSWDDGMEL